MKFKKILSCAVPAAIISAAVGVGIAANVNNETNANTQTLSSTTTRLLADEVENTTGDSTSTEDTVVLPTVDLTNLKSGVINVYKSVDEIMLVEDVQTILEQYIMDLELNIADLNIKINTDNYTGNGALKGSYMLVYNVTDLAEENSKNVVINIQVVDTLPKLYVATNSDTEKNQIVVKNDVELANKDISAVLTAIGEISGATGTFEATYTSKYFSNPSKVGTYELKYEVRETSGNSASGSIEIKVVSSSAASDSGSFGAKTKNFFKKIGNFFKKIGKGIAKPFVWLWDHTFGKIGK